MHVEQPVKLGGHSEVVPLLPIPNRTVKRLSADDSVDSHAKVGHCQAVTQANARYESIGRFAFPDRQMHAFRAGRELRSQSAGGPNQWRRNGARVLSVCGFALQAGEHPAVHVEHVAVDEVRCARGQENRRAAQLLHIAPARNACVYRSGKAKRPILSYRAFACVTAWQ